MTRKANRKKKCSRCGKIKSYSDFYRNMTKSDNHNNICKKCQKEVNKNN